MNTPTPESQPVRSTRRAGLIGGALGSIGLATSLLLLSGGAGAQEAELTTPESAPIETTDVDNSVVLADGDFVIDESAFEAFDKCLADAGVFDSLDAQIIDADELGDHELEMFDIDELPAGVSIMDGDSFSYAEFGDGDGSITITKNGDDISVTSDGDVSVEEFSALDELGNVAVESFVVEGDDIADLEGVEMFELDEEFEAAFASCEGELPELPELPEGVAVPADAVDAA